ncbi:MAG: hypothetical protein Q9180_009887, partial [Flavoplaca navasiana]
SPKPNLHLDDDGEPNRQAATATIQAHLRKLSSHLTDPKHKTQLEIDGAMHSNLTKGYTRYPLRTRHQLIRNLIDKETACNDIVNNYRRRRTRFFKHDQTGLERAINQRQSQTIGQKRRLGVNENLQRSPVAPKVARMFEEDQQERSGSARAVGISENGRDQRERSGSARAVGVSESGREQRERSGYEKEKWWASWK